jgi:hypothetical protein
MSAIRSFEIVGRTLAVLALVLSLTQGCITEPDTMDNSAANALVEIVSMEGEPGGGGESGTDLFSDVCTGANCSVFNDNGIVTMRAFPKDRTQLDTENIGINTIVFERYRVTYVRADGRNVPGVDVPYPFDGVANFSVAVDGAAVERGFVVVRHQAKLESPLRELVLAADLISTLARIDFYGHDGAGHAVTATAYLSITFGDFGDAP